MSTVEESAEEQGEDAQESTIEEHVRNKHRKARSCRSGPDPIARVIWRGMADKQLKFRVAGPWVHPARRLPLLSSRALFEQVNSKGLPGMTPHLKFSSPNPELWADRFVTFEPEILTLLPKRDEALQYGTCAVVGNSGRLVNARHGAEIDTHDAVFRINYAPVHGFTEHVGSKTTFDVVNSAHARFMIGKHRESKFISRHGKERNSTVLVFEVMKNDIRRKIFPSLLEKWGGEGRRPDTRPGGGLPPVALMSPHLVVHAQWLFSYLNQLIKAAAPRREYATKAMTGWYATFFALQVCERVNVYGFSPFTPHEGHWHGKYHYFDDNSAAQSHSFDLAYDILSIISSWPCTDAKFDMHLDN